MQYVTGDQTSQKQENENISIAHDFAKTADSLIDALLDSLLSQESNIARTDRPSGH